MHTTEWDRDVLRTTLQELMDQADLTQAAVGELAGRDRTMASRWLKGRHQPTYEAVSQFATRLRARRPDLGDLIDQFMRAAGYPAHPSGPIPAEGRTPQQALEDLRERASMGNETLLAMLIRERLIAPDELIIPDVLPPDDMMKEIMALDIPDENKANLLRLHLENRAQRAEEKRLNDKKPDGA